MARKLRLEIEGDSKSGRRALDDVADEADKTATATAVLGTEFRRTAKDGAKLEDELKDVSVSAKAVGGSVFVAGQRTGKLAEELREAARSAEKFDAALAGTRTEIAKLNKEYAASGDKEVTKKLQKQYAELDRVAKLKKRIAKDDEDAAKRALEFAKATRRAQDQADRDRRSPFRNILGDIAGIGQGASGTVSNVVGAFGPVGTGALIAGGAAASVPALAAGGGAVLGAGAIGAVGAGVAGAALGPDGGKVAEAWKAVLGDVKARYLDATTSWVGPTVASIGTLGKAFKQIPIEGIFRDSLKYLPQLTNGVAGFLTGVASGVDDLIRSAGPVVDKLEQKLPQLGGDLGDSFRILGEGAPGAADALGDVIDLAGNMAKAVAGAAAGAANLYAWAIDAPVLKQGHEFFQYLTDFKDLPEFAGKKLGEVAEATNETGRSFAAAATEAAKYAAETGTLTDSLTNLRTASQSAAEADLALAQGWLDLKDELADGKRTLDDTTQAGLDNRQALLNQAEAAEAARQKQILLTGDVDAANVTYAANIEKIKAMAVAAGFNKGEVEKLVSAYSRVQPVVSTKITTPGMGQALVDGANLGYQLSKLERTYTARFRLTGIAEAAAAAASFAGAHADGGVMGFSGPKLVGEEGPELVWGSRGEYVSTAQQTRGILSRMSAGGGGGSGGAGGVALTVAAAPGASGNPLIQMLLRAVDDGQLLFFDSTGQPVRTRP